MSSVAVTAPPLVSRERSMSGLLPLLPFAGIATAIAAVVSNGDLVIALIPGVAVVAGYVIYVVPVRYSLLACIFLSLTLDATDEGPWNSPLAPFGKLLAINLNKSLPINALALPGIVVIMLVLVGVILMRQLTGDRTDSAGRGETASVSFVGLVVSLAAIVFALAWGALRHGDVQMGKIQVQSFVYSLLMAYIAAMSLRGLRDYRSLGQIIIVSAIIRALYAIYVSHLLGPLPGDERPLNVAATHGDSLLFASAVVLLIVRFFEKPSSRAAAWCAAVIPVLALGMAANNRRLVWVEVAAGLLLFVLVSRRSRMKRLAATLALLSLPLLVVYVAAGWNSQSKIFAPVKIFRSVGDGQVDSSTLYRDLENHNLLMTMRLNMLTGAGFGQPFSEIVTLPNISFFKEYRYMPHNSILGLWAFTGPFGFVGIWTAAMVAVFLASRSYSRARSADERIAAFMVIATIAIYAAHCWGDIGFSERRSIFLLGPALAMAGQLARATGAWPRSAGHA